MKAIPKAIKCKSGEVYYPRTFVDAGSFGSVYTGFRKSDGLIIAIKDYKKGNWAKRIKLLKRIGIWGSSETDSLVHVLDYCSKPSPKEAPQKSPQKELYDGPGGYLIMDYVRGYNLEEFIRCQKKTSYKLGAKDLHTLFLHSAKTILRLHKVGIAHGDIKPSNIIYTAQRLVFIDYDTLCIDFDPSESEFSTEQCNDVGTVTYSSPDLLSVLLNDEPKKLEKNVALGNDVWALGLVMFELAMGRSWQSIALTNMSQREILIDKLKDLFQSTNLSQMLATTRADGATKTAIMGALNLKLNDRWTLDRIVKKLEQ